MRRQNSVTKYRNIQYMIIFFLSNGIKLISCFIPALQRMWVVAIPQYDLASPQPLQKAAGLMWHTSGNTALWNKSLVKRYSIHKILNAKNSSLIFHIAVKRPECDCEIGVTRTGALALQPAVPSHLTDVRWFPLVFTRNWYNRMVNMKNVNCECTESTWMALWNGGLLH